jgi:hypothetical protein
MLEDILPKRLQVRDRGDVRLAYLLYARYGLKKLAEKENLTLR